METSGFLFDPSLCRGNMLFLGNGGNPFSRGATSMMTMEDSESSKKRPFFGFADELFDEEYYDEQGSDKKRRLTAEQVHLLEKSFETENKLEPDRKTQLAKKLGLQPRQVAVWFQNRRARWKTKQLERDYDLLKSSYDLLLNKYDTVAKQNEQLKSEVISLSEKLQPKEVKEVPISGVMDNLVQTEDDDASASASYLKKKAEDRLSSGSGGSAVVDESPQLLDSGDSYFPCESYPSFVGPINGVHSEEDDGSDDGRNYLADVMAVAEQQRLGEEEPLEWWVWPLEE